MRWCAARGLRPEIISPRAPQARPGRRKRALQPCWPAPIQIGASPRAVKLAVALVVDMKLGPNWGDMQ